MCVHVINVTPFVIACIYSAFFVQQALELFQNGKPVTSEALEGFVDKQLMYFYNKQKLLAACMFTVQSLNVAILL